MSAPRVYLRGQKGASCIPELEFWMVISQHVVLGTTQALCKRSKCSLLLSRSSSPAYVFVFVYFFLLRCNHHSTKSILLNYKFLSLWRVCFKRSKVLYFAL